MIHELSNSGAIPALELSMRFAAQRQRLLAHNIANLSTPDFRPVDVSPRGFQQALADAVDRRRNGKPGEFRGNREVAVNGAGGLGLRPRTGHGGVLFHDRNNRDVERTMQDLVENAAAFRVASDLLRNRYQLLHSAIAERV